MSAFLSSIKSMVDNYGQGIISIQVQLEDMKFGLMPSPPSATPYTDPSTASTTPTSSLPTSRKNSCNNNTINMSINSLNATSDFNQWLHAMKMVARLPGGTPPEFRRKLWLALADRHLHTSGIDWNKEQTKCLSSETWLDDDEELGIQIVKDLHRTGSSLFSGPNGSINQAKLKRVLLGYARWNPEVGYCQGFNMLGALILQVMERSEIESLKVMIYLIEGVLPKGYFSGSLGGLQADMAVFREILSTRLPKLSKHLQKLQGTIGDNSMDPPLINVFTMQWFLTLFCTCLPKSCVLRVWDLILIEGSDILLRTALAIWASISERILTIKSADEFYCKMGTLSGELLNGHLFDSNGLIQRIVDLGPIADLQKMREKHLFNVTPWKDRKGLRIFYSDEDSDDENWKLLTGTRKTNTSNNRNQIPDTRERIALDISLLKKQYSKIRERQRQANQTNTTKQPVNATISNTKPSNINQYLIGRNAIVSNKKRHGPPSGAIPPARTALPMSVANKYQQKRLRNQTIDNASTSAAMKVSRSDDNSNVQQKKKAFARRRSESSSYSEDSDKGSDDELDNRISVESSSSSTSLCDDDFGTVSSIDGSPMKSRLHSSASDDSKSSLPKDSAMADDYEHSTFAAVHGLNTNINEEKRILQQLGSSQDSDSHKSEHRKNIDLENNDIHFASDDKPEKTKLDLLSLPQREQITSTSQLSPIADISNILSTSTISPLKTPTSYLLHSYPLCEGATAEENQEESSDIDFSINTGSSDKDFFKVSDEGVTNAYFERVNHVATISMDSKFPFSFIEDTPDTNLESRLSRSSQEGEDDDDLSSFKSEVRRLSDSFESAITSIEQVTSDLSKSSTNSISNTNSDAILKMIEENSKILDRIMCKNAQSTAQHITALDDKHQQCDEQLKSDSKDEDDKSNIESELKDTVEQPTSVRRHSIVPKVEITSEDEPEKQQENFNVAEATTSNDDDHVFKYGDLSDCISKYLTSTNEKSDKRIQCEKENVSIKSEAREKPPKSDPINLEIPATLSLLTHGEGSSEDIRNLLKESLFEYSKSPSESLPIDSKLENDLETLLKMSAELLREGFPLGSPQLETEPILNIDNEKATEDEPVPILALELDTEEKTDIIIAATETDDGNEKEDLSECSRTSMYLDADALQLEMESVAGDISATISSIKNTIKSIDSLCQDDDRRSRERTDRTLSDIIKVVEKLDEEKDNRKTQDISPEPVKPVVLTTVFEHTSREEDSTALRSFVDSPRKAASSRVSRDRSRMTSPRRRKDDDFGEYESRARRKSPSSSQNRYSGDFSSKLRFDEFGSSSDIGSKSKLGSPYKGSEKLEIRHTTVTSTFYDRFLSQKYEQQHKMDRSPSSPVINKAYLNSLKATPMTSSYTSGDKYRRDSRSTSPISSITGQRYDSLKYLPQAPKFGYLHLPQSSHSSINRDPCTRSCDNILSNLNASSSNEFIQKQSYQSKPVSDLLSISMDSEKALKRHSTGTFYQNTSPLQIKPKKPSEIGIKLGLYKPE